MTPPRQHQTITLAALTAAGMAYAIQQTLVIPALPALQRDLHTSYTWVTWVLTGFLLSSSALTPLLGRLGDQHGKERLLVISLAIFLAGTIGAACAWNIGSLIGFRVLQGTGGAVFPLSFAIIADEFPRERVGLAMGLVSAVLGAGGGLALVASGLIVDHLSWRWLFVIGAIVVAIALALVVRFVPESPVKTPSRLDIPGALLLAAGLTSMLVALSEGQNWGWTSAPVLGLFLVAAVLLGIFAVVEVRVPAPMVDMHMMARRPVLFTNLTAVVAGFAMFGAFVLIPGFVETPDGLSASVAAKVPYGFGASATKAGLYLLPGSLMTLVAGPLAGIMGRRMGSRWPLALGMLLVAIGAASFAMFHDHAWQIVAGMIVLGTGIGFAFAAMPKLISDAVDQTETGVANGMNTVMRSVGGVVGGQVGAALVSSWVIAGTTVPAVTGYTAAFWVSAVAALAGVGIALLIAPGRRARARATEAVRATAGSS
jgi:EmrB/QacA subfamily drug resistance transporter